MATLTVTTVSRDSAIVERVEWLSANTAAVIDGLVAVGSYDLLTDPRVVLARGPSTNSDVVGLVTDLYTMFFSVSAEAGVRQVRIPGDRFERADLVVGDWSDNDAFVVGLDRTRVAIRLESLTEDVATYVTTFLPPETGPSWPMHRPWMEPPVRGSTPNNFQMVRQGNQLLTVWGCEEFTVRNDIERTTGRAMSASMKNLLRWKIRLCVDETLTQCVDASDVRRERYVDLRIQ